MVTPLIFLPFFSRRSASSKDDETLANVERGEATTVPRLLKQPSPSSDSSDSKQSSPVETLTDGDPIRLRGGAGAGNTGSGRDQPDPDLGSRGAGRGPNTNLLLTANSANGVTITASASVNGSTMHFGTTKNVEFHAETLDTAADNDSPRKRLRPRHHTGVPFRRTDSTTSSEVSWHDKDDHDLSYLRRGLRKVKYFIFQNDPDRPKDESAFIPNYRYLPILSGCISPFAILLEIPGLTEHWYVRTENNVVVDYRPNPTILAVGMAISMACGVIANIALIARFLESRVKLMTIICMSFLVIHDLINIATVIIFGVIHRFDDGFTYGEAFWMIVCSTLCSVTVAITLALDMFLTPNFARSGSGLTRKQRSLIIMVMILICYIALGSLVFSVLMTLTFQDGLYFTVTTIETIGFGDIAPLMYGPSAAVFCILYATIGIIIVGLVVTTTRETIIEGFENVYRKRATEVARRRHDNKVLKNQRRARRLAIERQLKEAGLPVYIKVGHTFSSHVGGGRGGAGSVAPGSKWVLNELALEQWRRDKAEKDGMGMMSTIMRPVDAVSLNGGDDPPPMPYGANNGSGAAVGGAGGGVSMKGRSMSREMTMLSTTSGLDRTAVDFGPRSMSLDALRDQDLNEESYGAFRKRIKKEEQREFITKLAVTCTLFVIFWLVGAAIFSSTERWGFGTSMYFCWMAFSTIGFGDVTPKTPAGRAIFVVWALMGVAAMTILISVLSEAYSSRYQSALRKGTFGKTLRSFEGKIKMKLEHELHQHHLDNEKNGGARGTGNETDRDRDTDHAGDDEGDTEAEAMDDDMIGDGDAGDQDADTDGHSSQASTSRGSRSPMRRSSDLLATGNLNSPMFGPTAPSRQPSRAPTPSPSRLATNILHSKRAHLDSIPLDVLRHAKSFHDHVRYFAHQPGGHHHHHHGSGGGQKDAPPQELHELLEEIAESEKMDDRMKDEMLGDDEARRALFFMSYDRAFRKLIDAAENAVRTIAAKDAEWEHLIEVLKRRETHDERNADVSGLGPPATGGGIELDRARNFTPSPLGIVIRRASSPESMSARSPTPRQEKKTELSSTATPADVVRQRAILRSASRDSTWTTTQDRRDRDTISLHAV